METRKLQSIALPDPCSHVSRMDIIRAKLGSSDISLDELIDHVEQCRKGKS